MMSPPVYSYYTEEWNCWAASCASEWLHATIQGTQMHKFVCVCCEGFYLFIFLRMAALIYYTVYVLHMFLHIIWQNKRQKRLLG